MRTGLRSKRCYAAALGDCDGRPATREHYVTKALLERIGSRFYVSGLPWLDEPTELTEKNLTSKTLCERHNGRLSPCDTAICQLFDGFTAWHRREKIEPGPIDGDALERWGLKLIAGFASSGNLIRNDGQPTAKTAPPEPWLRMMFDEDPFPERCGFYVPEEGRAGIGEFGVTFITRHDEDDGGLYATMVRMLGFAFVVSVKPFHGAVHYRPSTLVLGDAGQLNLAWRSAPPSYAVRVTR